MLSPVRSFLRRTETNPNNVRYYRQNCDLKDKEEFGKIRK